MIENGFGFNNNVVDDRLYTSMNVGVGNLNRDEVVGTDAGDFGSLGRTFFSFVGLTGIGDGWRHEIRQAGVEPIFQALANVGDLVSHRPKRYCAAWRLREHVIVIHWPSSHALIESVMEL